MTERVVAPAAAAVAIAASALAGMALSLILTVPTGRVPEVATEGGLLPLVQSLLAMMWDALWTALERL